MFLRYIYIIGCVILLSSCNTSSVTEFDFLIGRWKVEHKDQFEVWEKNDKQILMGSGIKVENDQERVLETLQIINNQDQIYYIATVSDQNEKKPITFTLNRAVEDVWSFENPNHDFPKKIQYKKVDEHTLYIQVLGENDKGFSFRMVKQ